MKKKYIFAMIAAVSIGTIACSDGNKKNADSRLDAVTVNRDIKFESFTYDFIGEYFSSDTLMFNTPGGKYVRYIGQGVLPQDIGNSDVRILRDTLMKIAHVRFADEDRPEPVLTDSIRLTDLEANDSIACGEVISNLVTTLVTPRVVVWENTLYTYPCLAAHGISSTVYINFGMDNGRIINLSDLLKPDYEKPLAAMIAERIKTMDIQLLVSPEEIGVPEQFEITSRGIIFSYDPYQIAPYSEGTVQVELNTGDLYNLLSPRGTYILTGITE